MSDKSCEFRAISNSTFRPMTPWMSTSTYVGPVADARGSLETPFDLKVYAFNRNEEDSILAHEATVRARRRFVDGREAFAEDFWRYRGVR